jgi:hypothetical protein
VTVRSSMGHSIHPAGAARAKRSWRLSSILSPNSPREAPPRTAKVSGSGRGIAAGRFILGTMETVLW